MSKQMTANQNSNLRGSMWLLKQDVANTHARFLFSRLPVQSSFRAQTPRRCCHKSKGILIVLPNIEKTNWHRLQPCCVCKDEKAARDHCMLFSASDNPEKDCEPIMSKYRSCMASYGFSIWSRLRAGDAPAFKDLDFKGSIWLSICIQPGAVTYALEAKQKSSH